MIKCPVVVCLYIHTYIHTCYVFIANSWIVEPRHTATTLDYSFNILCTNKWFLMEIEMKMNQTICHPSGLLSAVPCLAILSCEASHWNWQRNAMPPSVAEEGKVEVSAIQRPLICFANGNFDFTFALCCSGSLARSFFRT